MVDENLNVGIRRIDNKARRVRTHWQTGFVKTEAVAHGIQSGLRYLSLFVGGLGLVVTALLVLPGKKT